MKNKVKYLIQKNKKLEEIATTLNLPTTEVIGYVHILKEEGFPCDVIHNEIYRFSAPHNSPSPLIIPSNLSHMRLLLISDTHLCSKYDRLDILNYLYDKALTTDTTAILHSGDLADGYYLNRPQHLYELRVLGFDEHLDYVTSHYPKLDNIPTYFIGGNHHATYLKNGGSDIGKHISAARPDLIYLNPESANLRIGKLKIHMHHGGGGRAYSMSYKLQRYAETLVPDTPHILTQGHFHNSMYMNYMNTHCFQVGALIDQTPFAEQMGFKNEKSCWWVDIEMDDKGEPHTITPTLETFSKKLVRKRI